MRLDRIGVLSSISHNFRITAPMPRTTLTLDRDAYALARRYASARRLRLSQAVSELVRRGLESRRPVREENGLVVFDLPSDSPPVTPEDVRRADED